MLSFLVPGQRREETIAREVEPGVYQATVQIPEHGAYSIHVASKTLKQEYKDLASLACAPRGRTSTRRSSAAWRRRSDEVSGVLPLLAGMALCATARAHDPRITTRLPRRPATAKVVLRRAAGRLRQARAPGAGGDRRRIAVVNFIYTSHTGVPGVLGHLRQLQQKLGSGWARRWCWCRSPSTRCATRRSGCASAARYEAREAGLLSWRDPDVDSVLKGFGAYSARFEDHPAMVLVGDARRAWTRFPRSTTDGAHRHGAGGARGPARSRITMEGNRMSAFKSIALVFVLCLSVSVQRRRSKRSSRRRSARRRRDTSPIRSSRPRPSARCASTATA